MSTFAAIVEKFQRKLREHVSFQFSYGRPTLGKNGVVNRFFSVPFMWEEGFIVRFFEGGGGLLKDNLVCDKCGSFMKLRKKNISDGFIWSCRKTVKYVECGFQKSIRFDSWFRGSNLKLEEIVLLTYELVRGTKTGDICDEYFFSSSTLVGRMIFNFT